MSQSHHHQQTQLLVVGSSNTDMVINTDRLPAPGETILGGTFLMNAGGKGANQAVAAARLGGHVTLVAKVGDDLFGHQTRADLQREHIDTRFVFTDPDRPSGVALINVDAQGENAITVASGANAALEPAEVKQATDTIDEHTLVLCQLEIPLHTVVATANWVVQRGARLILNPAPAQTLPPAVLQSLFLITPNETEAEHLTGIRITDDATARQAATVLHALGVTNVVITLGARGALLSERGQMLFVPAMPVTAVDTTAAGDCFNGALAVALANHQSLPEAVTFACRAAAISVTRRGAQGSMPYLAEL